VQDPSYTASENTGDSDLIVTLTVTASCDGASPLGDSDSTTLTVQPVAHELEVFASVFPSTVISGKKTALTGNYNDTHEHSIAYWLWEDGGAGGSFDPSTDTQNPLYWAPQNPGLIPLLIPLNLTANCDGPEPIQGSDEAPLEVLPAGVATVGLHDAATSVYRLINHNATAAAADLKFRFGPVPSSWLPFAGDWNADGEDTVGSYDPATGTFRLINANAPAAVADVKFRFGPGPCNWKPIAGDWDGDGDETVGLYDPATGTFRLINSNATSATADMKFVFSSTSSTWLPIAGDWDGDGVATIGLYDPATGYFHLRNANSAGPADLSFRFGPAPSSWLPMAGDWDGDGDDTVGLYDAASGTFRLINNNAVSATSDLKFRFGPAPCTWKPIAGDWDGA
jgi:hypothetical protein